MKLESNCTNCPLHLGAKQVVWGEGPVPARVMVVAEAPGRDEDRAGRPLVGQTGRTKFALLLQAAGLQREDIYITNVVKHRPPANRKPKAGEVKACLPWLLKELLLVKPEVVLALGATAIKALAPDARLGKDHGKPLVVGDLTIIPMHHPAAAFYSPGLWPIMLEDWERAGAYLRGELSTISTAYTPTVYHGLPSYFAFDLETTTPQTAGRFDAYRAVIIGWSAAHREGEVFAGFSHDPLSIGLLTDRRIICHNSRFEIMKLKQMGYSLRGTIIEDTKLAAWLLGYPSTHLKDLASQLLGANLVTFKELTKGRTIEEVPPEELAAYGTADSVHTLLLWERLEKELQQHRLWGVYEEIERPLVPILVDMELRGVHVDAGALAKVEWDLHNYIASSRTLATVYGLPADLNLNSHQQLAVWLEAEGAPLMRRTGVKRQLSTDAAALETLTSKKWRPLLVEAVRRHRQLGDLLPFAQQLQEYAIDGVIHPEFNQAGRLEEASDTSKSAPVTGRLSCSKPNLQQIPHHGTDPVWSKRLRDCIVAGPGHVLVVGDVSQQEPRVAAVVVPEPALLKDFEEGRHPYGMLGRIIYSREVTKQDEHEWFVSKTFFLALGYGASWTKLRALDPTLPLNRAKLAAEEAAARYSGFAGFRRRTQAQLEEEGGIRDWFGRVRWFPGYFGASQQQKDAMLREAVNFQVQGPAASCTKLAMIRLAPQLSAIGAHLILAVHDELVVETPEHLASKVADMLYSCMDGLMPVKMPVEVRVGRTWGTLE